MLQLVLPKERTVPNKTEEDIKKGLAKAERGLRKENRIVTAQSQYIDALSEYVNINYLNIGFNIDILQHPEEHFVYYNHELHYIRAKAIRLDKDIRYAFNFVFGLPCSPDGAVERKVLESLIKLLKELKAVPQYQRLMNEFEEYNKMTFPLEYFFLMEGTLCYKITYNETVVSCCVLDKSNINALVIGNNFLRSIPLVKALPILKSIKKKANLLELKHVKCDNPYYLHMKGRDGFYTVQYDKEQRAFHSVKPHIQRVDATWPANIDISHLFQYIRCDIENREKVKVSPSMVSFLYKLMNGDFQNFINLSLLFANIASPELITPKLFLISYSDGENEYSMAEMFIWMVELIFNGMTNDPSGFNKMFATIGQLVQKKNLSDLADCYFKNLRAIYILKGESKLSELQLNNLKQHVRGSRVQAKDPKIGAVYFKNTCPIVCFSNNQKEISFLEQNVPCVRIRLEDVKLDKRDIPNPQLYPEAYEWAKLCISLYGLYLLAEKKFYKIPLPKAKKIPTSVASDSIVNAFLGECCMAAGDFIYADELYQAYCEYHQTVYGNTPLKRVQFATILRRSGISYKRPHVSKDAPNKYAFMDIALKEHWKDEIQGNPYSLSMEEVDFMTKLQEIDTLLMEGYRNPIEWSKVDSGANKRG